MTNVESPLDPAKSIIHRHLLNITAGMLPVCAALVVLCYLFVDRPVAFWVHDHRLGQDHWLKQPTNWNSWLEDGAPIIIALLVLRRAFGAWRRHEWVLLAAALSILVASGIAEQVKVVFGRPWPETWTHNNSSLIGNGDFAFRWFHGSDEYGSFPSGHTTVICAAMSVVWIAWPRVRWLAAVAVIAVIVGLIGDDYHFVGDVVAGGFLGTLAGVWSCAVLGLLQPKEIGGQTVTGRPHQVATNAAKRRLARFRNRRRTARRTS